MEEGSMAEEDGEGRGKFVEAVVGMGEVPAPPGVRHTTGEGEDGASNEIRTVMEGMKVG